MAPHTADLAPWLNLNDVIIALRLSRGDDAFDELASARLPREIDFDYLEPFVTQNDVTALHAKHRLACAERDNVKKKIDERIAQSRTSRVNTDTGGTEEADTYLEDAKKLIDDYGVADNAALDLLSAINTIKSVLERR